MRLPSGFGASLASFASSLAQTLCCRVAYVGNFISYTQSYKIVVLYRTTTAYLDPFKILRETIGDGILSLLVVLQAIMLSQ